MSLLSSHFLRTLRNEIPLLTVIKELELPHKYREDRFVFLCPRCSDFHTSIHPKENLGRCFKCKINFNPIDLVMSSRQASFKEACLFLRRMI